MGTAVGPCALHRQGLVTWYLKQTMQTTAHPSYSGKHICFAKLYYLPDLDADNMFIDRIVKTNFGPMRLPTKERALCDYLRHLDVLEEFYFAAGLHDYLWEEGSPDKLLEVARHYGIEKEMQKWIDDDANYEDYG